MNGTGRTALQTALDPRSVAVVGASADPDKVGGRPIAYLRRFGFTGTVHPVNPRRGEVQGLPTVPSLADLDGPVDAVLIAVPGAAAVDAVEEAAAATPARSACSPRTRPTRSGCRSARSARAQSARSPRSCPPSRRRAT